MVKETKPKSTHHENEINLRLCTKQGAVDQNGYEQVHAAALKTKEVFDAGQYAQATSEWSKTEYVIMRVAHNIDFYNVLKKIPSYSSGKCIPSH